MIDMQDRLREIRQRLRLAMNGVVAASMREKGVVYKLNFGVPVPELRQIAASYEKDAALAATLWKKDIREFKILAILLQPAEELSVAEARRWVKAIPYPEIAELAARYLFSRMPGADAWALDLLEQEGDKYAVQVAFLTLAGWLADGYILAGEKKERMMAAALDWLSRGESAGWKEKRAAVQALRFYGTQATLQATEVLATVCPLAEGGTAEQREFAEELKFEFEYQQGGFAN